MTDEPMSKPWDQLPDESDTAYVRFLIYRDMGPARSLDAAYTAAQGQGATKRSKTQLEANGSWTHDSAQYHWPARARAWDRALLVDLVPEAAGMIFHAVNETARVTLQRLLSGKLQPRTWPQLMETVTILAGFISPETIRAAIDNAEPGISAQDGEPGEEAV